MAHSIPISDYIALGSLISPIVNVTAGAATEWHEVSRVSPNDAAITDNSIRHQTASAIERLVDAKLLRVFGKNGHHKTYYRLYRLPDNAGLGSIGTRNTKGLRTDLEHLLSVMSISKEHWKTQDAEHQPFEPWANAEDGSLFYIFNTLQSPNPDPGHIKDPYAKLAIRELLDETYQLPGLKSNLYPYQARSSAAMVEQESTLEARLDPRYEVRHGPDGHVYYFIPRELIFSKTKPMYESNRGGILAETMGYGKTVICLATILATKHHLPKIPPQYFPEPSKSKSVPTLLDLALQTAGRFSVPARAHLDRVRRRTGDQDFLCLRRLEELPTTYLIPDIPPRSNRRALTPEPKKMILCSGTIIVVPKNLVHQWTSEIRKHVEEGDEGLKVLVLDGPTPMPDIDTLRRYDVILFSKPRFEKEIKHGSDTLGRNLQNTHLSCRCPYIGATRVRDCTCLKAADIYFSPLQRIHWLRIIVDEGHEFSSATSNAVEVASNLVTAERRWIVSGTPARDRLYGIEVNVAANSNSFSGSAPVSILDDDGSSLPTGFQALRSQALENRSFFNKEEESAATSAAKSVGALVQNFLKVRPWAHDRGESKIEWDDHIYQHLSYRSRTYSAFSSCLRRVMEDIVVKTRPEDVEKDIVLPPLTHRTVLLQPSFYDKLTANLFVLFLTSNAVCSERSDQDYLFHKNSAKARHQLITNLRQSNFFWTGFSSENISSAMETSLKYLSEENINCTTRDRDLLKGCIELAQIVLDSDGWRALSHCHEVGAFVQDWPQGSSETWALTTEPGLLMVGAGPLASAQRHVDERLFDDDPTSDLANAGKLAKLAIEMQNQCYVNVKRSQDDQTEIKIGVPSSAVQSERSAKRQPARSEHTKSPQKSKKPITSTEAKGSEEQILALKRSRKRKRSLDLRELDPNSPLRKTSIIGTVSAKLSYLLDQISEHHLDEKIIVFYDGENAAYYLAQCLDVLHIKHLIYAKSLSNDMKSRYIVSFDADESIRVLLMDIRSGAFGLNINKASRVYFINPVCRPSTEVQAIKRAHRIGQTKPVHVETLILKGTIEEAIFERSKNMTQTEHSSVSQLDDDSGVASIIKNAQTLPITAEEGKGLLQMAPLKKPLQLFGRPGRGDTTIKGIDKDIDLFDGEAPTKRARAAKISNEGGKGAESAATPTHRLNASSIPIPPTVSPVDVLQQQIPQTLVNGAAQVAGSTLQSIFGP